MTISNAIPVQFWINGVDTYNETTICGVEPVCFCQPFNCTDEIRIQFQHTSGVAFSLLFANATEGFNSISIPEIDSGVYGVSFNFSDYSICDETVNLYILETVNLNKMLAPSAWTIYSAFDIVNATQFADIAINASPTAGMPVNILTGNTPYPITVSYVATVNSGFMTVTMYYFNTLSANYACTFESIDITAPGTTFGTLTFDFGECTSDANELYIDVSSSVAGVNSISLTMPVNMILGVGDYSAKSDCLDIKTSHDCTELIQYINTDDFSNIVYLTSPASEFSIRIPAQFWKEDNPMEQEDSELSNGVIKTRRQSIQEKRLLEVGYMPNYMHKKLQLVLMHDTITIDGDQWKRRDAYESEPIRRYPLKKANVWLTKYNSIEDNII
jgi:hypothetical protein